MSTRNLVAFLIVLIVLAAGVFYVARTALKPAPAEASLLLE